MMRSHSHVNTVKAIIRSYDGNIPLAAWLKQFFKSDKKFGSRDRKEISHACYCYYRLGNSFLNLVIEERVLLALFLCSSTKNKILEELKPLWNEKVSLKLTEKVKSLSASEEVKNIFPFSDELSNEIETESFHFSFLTQPDLFLRIRPGKKEKLIQQIENKKGHSLKWPSYKND